MAEYQVTYWRDLPSPVVARSGGDPAADPADVTKLPLPGRFQEAIDEAAMRLDATDSNAYLAGWWRGDWVTEEGTTADVVERVAAELESRWPPAAVTEFLAGLGNSREAAGGSST